MTTPTTPTSGAADLPEALKHAEGLESFAEHLPAYGFDSKPLKEAAATIRRLHALLEAEDAAHCNTIEQRDEAEKLGTMLANAVAEHFRVEVGEYSNLNDPRLVALEILGGGYITDSDADRKIAALAAGQPSAQHGAAYAALPDGVATLCEYGGDVFTAAQMRAFADATCALHASHGQAPAAPTTQPVPQREPAEIDPATMELAEIVGLIGPASRTHDLHAAIQRFHDLICVNATIKAAQMAAETISKVAPPQEPVAWQSRMRPAWGGNTAQWYPWENCTKEQAEDYWKTPLLHDWAYEARALYTEPKPSPAAQGDALDTIRLDWLDADESRCVFHLGKSWYTRPSYGMPYRKRASLREAIDAAIAAQEGKSHG